MSPGERGDYGGFDSEEEEDDIDDGGEGFEPSEHVLGTAAQEDVLRNWFSFPFPEPGSFEAFEEQDGNSVEVDMFLDKWNGLYEDALDCGLSGQDLRDALKLLAPRMRGTCLGKDRAAIEAQNKKRAEDDFNSRRAFGEGQKARLARLAQEV